MGLIDFNNVKDQVGFCGIWCGSCVVGNGALRRLTRKYKEMTDSYDLKDWAPKDFDYAEFAKGLSSIQEIPVCPGCRMGGGRDDCELRACSSARGFRECAECGAGDDCSHRGLFDHMRSGALSAGLIVRTSVPLEADPIEEWTSQVASKWPCSVLFEDET
jgi:hypothetical protein